jgi:ABC-type lipoprotein export system ATPase subunit
MTAHEGERPVVSARDLFCLYEVPDGSVAALRGLTLTVAAGERLLVHGPNGSGKTTLLRVLMGQQAPSAGAVEVCGVDLSTGDDRVASVLRRRDLGVVDQHSARILRPELTVAQNVALQSRLLGVPRAEAVRRATTMLERLGVAAHADRSPATLSGGEAQRVAVCAAVAHRPTLVLADEPTGELDSTMAADVYELLRDAVRAVGASLVLVTHDPNAAHIADRVVRIRDGRLSEEWSPDEPTAETLVVDDRGWLRLPHDLRRASGGERGMRARIEGNHIRLDGIDEPSSMPEQAERPPERQSREVVAAAKSVSVRRAGRTVLDGIDFQVTAGALNVVEGRSGSGKSTLLSVLLGMSDPDEGEASLFGHDLRHLGRSARADLRHDSVAVAGQVTALVEALSVDENFRASAAGRGLVLDGVRLETVVAALALGPLRRRPVRMLSGGERQRVATARCLLSGRPLIVLDEPTSQQDEAHAELVVSALRDAARAGTAVLCASHDPVLLAAADVRLSLA